MHQLASVLISLGFCVQIYYYELSKEYPLNKENPVHDVYKKYHVPYTFDLEDSPHNICIFPEVFPYFYDSTKYIQRVLWWMSINNYLETIKVITSKYLEAPLDKPLPHFFTFYDSDKAIEHWGQSEHVRRFLRLNGITKITAVETHMSQTFLSRASYVNLVAKKNFVAYNPIKGFEFTEQLIKLAPDIDWRPIENMTPAQVQAFLAEAKIYIDLGEFPGRERLPREAILSGCVVITGKRGAAANDTDINIPAEFKFGFDDSKPQQVIDKIRAVFENFNEAHASQKAFRDKELNAQKNFIEAVTSIANIKKLPPLSVALIQGVGEKSYLLAQELLLSEEFKPCFIVDDVLATAKISDELLLRKQHRNYLRVGENSIEIISGEDAQFLYREKRIKKFALLEPTDEELATLKNFYEADEKDFLIFKR